MKRLNTLVSDSFKCVHRICWWLPQSPKQYGALCGIAKPLPSRSLPWPTPFLVSFAPPQQSHKLSPVPLYCVLLASHECTLSRREKNSPLLRSSRWAPMNNGREVFVTIKVFETHEMKKKYRDDIFLVGTELRNVC